MSLLCKAGDCTIAMSRSVIVPGCSPIEAEANGWDGIHNGVDVIGLKGAHAGHMMGLVQSPAGLIVMPQHLVRPSCPHLHAHLHAKNRKSPRKGNGTA